MLLSMDTTQGLHYTETDHICPPTVIGKLESSPDYLPRKSENYLPWHAHITALTVAPSSRRLGHAKRLTEALEQVADEANAYFVDLYVRAENTVRTFPLSICRTFVS